MRYSQYTISYKTELLRLTDIKICDVKFTQIKNVTEPIIKNNPDVID